MALLLESYLTVIFVYCLKSIGKNAAAPDDIK